MSDPHTWLAADVYAALDEDDLIFLAAEADTYACLPAAGRGLVLDRGGRRLRGLTGSQAADLTRAGLLAENCAAGRSWSLPSPGRDLLGRARPSATIGERLAFAAVGAASLFSYQRQPFARLLTPPRAGVPPQLSDRLIRRAEVFAALLPWSPIQGACLLQALALRNFLRRIGLDAHWVFGVRTWPFSAHCWLQVEDLVLNDSFERVAGYRPILIT